MDQVILEPIGYVRSPLTRPVDTGWGSVVSTVEVLPRYRRGLEGLDSFSHLVVVTFLHEADFDAALHLERKPRGDETMPDVGIFAQRAKHRPNPIGVTSARIVGVTETGIEVRGLDAIDGTPVLDIKPYVPAFDRVDGATVPAWMDDVMKNYF